jgi:hypothetical protein
VRYKDDVAKIEKLHDGYLGAIYNAYKPNPANATQYLEDPTDRDKSQGQLDEDLAREKATRFHHWTKNATESSNRLFEELIAATSLATDRGRGFERITMGVDTKVEPDIFFGRTEALEVKHVDSGAFSAVDEHVRKGTAQLEKRRRNTVQGNKIKRRTLHIRIKDADNTYPYTKTEFNKIGKPNKKRLEKQLRKRAASYRTGDKEVLLKLISANPKIGTVDVEI